MTLGLGVGGIRHFPDNCTTGLPQGGLHPKPWRNTDPKVRKGKLIISRKNKPSTNKNLCEVTIYEVKIAKRKRKKMGQKYS